jgi:hypothetical protein
LVERANGYLEISFLPGRVFVSPDDFNAQLNEWLVRANTRTVRSIDAGQSICWKPAIRRCCRCRRSPRRSVSITESVWP